jgi:regulator of sirC expression with transglutaminase-like and TPR domain
VEATAESPRERFARIVAAPDRDIHLDEAALWIAAEEYPTLDVRAYLARLDALASTASSRLAPVCSAAERAARLNHLLFVEVGFAGNRTDYYDPRNSYLSDVLDRKTGIPITLAVIYMEVARRLELDVRGISFPGHFLVKWVDDADEREVVVDPFLGTTLRPEDCHARLAQASGGALVLRPELHLRAASRREILVRMLANLKHVFVSRRDFGRALACCERILLLVPDAPLELRDRGLILEQLACFAAAASDLDRFLWLAPDDPGADAVRARRDALRARVGRPH